MLEGHVEATEGSRGPRRWRYFIDIVALVVVTFALDAVLGALVQEPISWKTGFVLDAIGKILLVAVGCGLVYYVEVADIGLNKPRVGRAR